MGYISLWSVLMMIIYWEKHRYYREKHRNSLFFLLLVGWDQVLRYCGHFWPIVQRNSLIGLEKNEEKLISFYVYSPQ
jgi:hypothetical protein